MTKTSLGVAMSKAASRTGHFGRTGKVSPAVQPLKSYSQVSPVAGSKPPRPPSRVGKKVVSGYFDPDVSKQLARLGIDQDRTNEDLLREALNDLFAKYQLPPIA